MFGIGEVVGALIDKIPKRKPLEERLRNRQLKLEAKLSRKEAKRRARAERKKWKRKVDSRR